MNFDGLTMTVLTKELNSSCIGRQIQSLIQPDKTTLQLKLSGPQKIELLITVGNYPACFITEGLKDLPKVPSSQTMFLRKQLEGGRITDIKQIHDDRIICITIDRLAMDGSLETKELYIELMGKHSNCILVEKGVVVEALIHVTPLMSQVRPITPKTPYTLPPHANRMCIGDFDAKTIADMIQNYSLDTVGRTIRNLFNGFGDDLLTSICTQLSHNENTSIDKFTPMTELTEEKITSLSNILYATGQKIKESHTLYEYVTNKKKHIYAPLPLAHLGQPYVVHNKVSPLVEREIKNKNSIYTTKQELASIIDKAIKKEALRLTKIEEELRECGDMDLFKEYGDLLMIYAYLPHAYKNEITVVNYLSTDQKDITIPLLPNLTMTENGQRYYKLYNKLKKRWERKDQLLQSSNNRLDYYNSILFSLDQSTTKNEIEEIKRECEEAHIINKRKVTLQTQQNKSKILTIPINHGNILIGRNNKQNDYITHKLGRPNDLWFHALKTQGAHVLLQTEGSPTDSEIVEAASYAAYYSKGAESPKVAIDYTEIKNVKKPPKSPLGYVTYTKQRTLMVPPQKPTIEMN